MTRDELVQKRSNGWKRLGDALKIAEAHDGIRRLGPDGIAELAQLYRALASDLMMVRRDKLGADLERHLDALAARAHNALYAGTAVGNGLDLRSLFVDFAPAVRRNARFFFVAFLLFYGPLFAAALGAYFDESYALAVLSESQLHEMESMYRTGHAAGREGNVDAAMTGFYVWNNIGIAFRCFATGILFGLGPIFYLLQNGLIIGAVFGHLTRSGLGENILSFVATHSPWELNAIVIAGGAGLQMGYALVSTGGRTRLGNLQAHGLELLRQIAGATLFLAIAALLEAWYSPSSLPPVVKYASGTMGMLLVFSWLVFGGRGRRPPDDVRALTAESSR